MGRFLAVCWLGLVTIGLAYGQTPPAFSIENTPDGESLTGYTETWVDPTGQATFEQVRVGDLPWTQLTDLDMPLPLEHHLWARFRLRNQLPDTAELILRTGASDHVTVYIQQKGDWVQKLAGNYIPPRKRDIGTDNHTSVGISLAPGDSSLIYVRLQERLGVGPTLTPSLYTRDRYFFRFYRDSFVSMGFIFLFQGAVLMIMLYNAVMFLSVRTPLYGYYALYLLCLALLLHVEVIVQRIPILGLSHPLADYLAGLATFNLTSVFYLQFGRAFIDTRTHHPTWDKILRGLIGVRLALIGIGAFITLWQQQMSNFGVLGVGLYGLESLILIPFFYTLIRSKSVVARYFIVGSTLVFGFGFFLLFLRNLIGLDINPFVMILISLGLEILVFSLGLGYKMRQQQREKLQSEQSLNEELTKINTAFGRFVPHEFLRSLGHQSVLDVQLGDQVEKEVTVFFSDIRGYTTLAEDMTPAQSFQFLNAYLGRVGPVIQRHGGFVNQYYGDGIMALFLDSPRQALAAAEETHEVLRQYNAERMEKGRTPIQIGIGMHTGPLMMGIIGDTLRLEASVVSDTVNTTARMEGLTKYFGAGIILSETVWRHLSEEEQSRMRYLGRVLVKGRRKPTHIYESLAGQAPATARRMKAHQATFEEGLEAYFKGDFATALHRLESLREVLSEDQALAYYERLARHYLLEGPPAGWAGVETMLDK